MASEIKGFADLPIAAKVGLLILLLGVATAVYAFVFHFPAYRRD